MEVIAAPSPNFDERPPGTPVDILLLHYTGMDSGAAAVARLCDPEARVSAHYTVDEDGTVFAHVAEERRAWHAGLSYWAGARDVNGRSIDGARILFQQAGAMFEGHVDSTGLVTAGAVLVGIALLASACGGTSTPMRAARCPPAPLRP